MILTPTPKCHLSNQICTKVCINKTCKQPAFICKNCQEDKCQQLHYHSKNKLEVVRWSEIMQMTTRNSEIKIQADMKKQVQQTFTFLEKEVSRLIDGMNSILQTYSKNIKLCDKYMKMEPNFKNAWNSINQRKCGNATGKSMRILYDQLKQGTHILNMEEIMLMKNKETQNVHFLLQNIRQKLGDYMKNDLTVTSSNWKTEQLQQLKTYNQQIKDNPKDEKAYMNRAILYYNRKEYRNALSDYNKAIECKPKYASAYCNRALLYEKRNELDKALEDYNLAIQYDRKYSTAYNNRANLYKVRNQLDMVLDDYDMAIRCDPKYTDAYYNRALFYEQIKQIQLALNDYNKVIQLNPKDSDAYCNRGTLYKNKNQLDKALQDYNLAISLNPAVSQYYNNRGDIFLKKSMLHNALFDYSYAIERKKNPVYFRKRAKVYRLLKRLKQAESDQKIANDLSEEQQQIASTQ